jgi:hypothetical protein
MGYTTYACGECGEARYMYGSCSHRFCPTCGSAATRRWADKVLHNVLNIKHHHVVVTLPAWLRGIAKRNDTAVYDAMFASVREVILGWFKHKHQIEGGIIAVLHTGGSDLKYHPHLHLVVTGGGIQRETKEVQVLEGDYLFRHEWLKKRFRWVFQQRLIALHDTGQLKTPETLRERPHFLRFLRDHNRQDWVVSIQEPLKNAESIVRYVGRYTKRACLSEYKIEEVKEEHITFRYNDYKNTPKGQKPKEATMRLHYVPFLDRLLQHVPTEGFVQVRYYGCYAIGKMSQMPAEWKVQPTQTPQVQSPGEEAVWQEEVWEQFQQEYKAAHGHAPMTCPHCRQVLQRVAFVPPSYWKRPIVRQAEAVDSS